MGCPTSQSNTLACHGEMDTAQSTQERVPHWLGGLELGHEFGGIIFPNWETLATNW